MDTTPGGRTRMMMSGLHFICAVDIGDIDDPEYYTDNCVFSISSEIDTQSHGLRKMISVAISFSANHVAVF